MATVRELIKRLNDAWIDSNEEHYLHIWMSLIVLCVGGIMVFMLYSQTQRIDVLKKDNVALMEQLNIATAELTSLKAQVEFNVSPVISQEAKPIDIVIQSNAREIKGKVNEIQKQLIEGSSSPPETKIKVNPKSDVRQLNQSLQQTFCKSNSTHETCKEIR